MTRANDTPELQPRAPMGSSALPGVPRPVDAVDEELLALPAPPRGQRLLAMVLMAAVVGIALGLMTQLSSDLRYFFAGERVTDLGDVRSLDLASLQGNQFVRVRGTPMLSGLVRFDRPLMGEYAVFPLAGQRQVFVQLPASALQDPVLAAGGQYSGRLQTFGALGPRFRSVRAYLEQTMGMPVSSESFVVLAEEPPSAYVWTLLLFVVCAAIIAVNVWLLRRWFRPIKTG